MAAHSTSVRMRNGRGALRATVAGAVVAALTLCGVTGAPGADAAGALRLAVDGTRDLPDASPGDGRCRASDGTCTVRAAVMEAGSHPGSTIVVPSGHYTLTIPPPLGRAFEDYTLGDTASGNLKIMAPTTITGAGAGTTVIDGGRLDRVFTVLRKTVISGLTVTGGESAPTASPYNYYGGGGVLNASELTMERVHITRNTSTFGGGVFNIPFSSFTLRDSLVDYNEAGEAGGIRFDWQGLVERSTISHNRVVNPHDPSRPGELAGVGGGIDARILGFDIVDSKIIDNYADDGGGGLNITLGYLPDPGAPVSEAIGGIAGRIRLKNSVIGGNTTKAGPGDCRAVLARYESLGGNTDSDRSCRLTRPTDHPGGWTGP